VLHSVKSNGGIVQVNFYNQFIRCRPGEDPKDATLAHVADHIQYIGELIGWNHVGIGSDYDGTVSSYYRSSSKRD
jgi:membrane dipeptidase